MTNHRFDRDGLVDAFRDLGRRAYEAGKVIEISVYGGSALMLTYVWRVSTKDVDAIFEADKAFVRQQVASIAKDRGWDEGWLNDGVKGFVSAGDSDPSAKVLFGTFPSEEKPGLRVMVATPHYLFAMKCRAMRIGGVDENSDIDDIRKLAAEIGLKTADEALAVVAEYYSDRVLEPKTQFGLEEIFSMMNKQGSSQGSGFKP